MRALKLTRLSLSNNSISVAAGGERAFGCIGLGKSPLQRLRHSSARSCDALSSWWPAIGARLRRRQEGLPAEITVVPRRPSLPQPANYAFHRCSYFLHAHGSRNSTNVEIARLQHRFSATPKGAAPDLRPRPLRARSCTAPYSPASRRYRIIATDPT